MDSALIDRIRRYVEVHAAQQLEFTIDLCSQNSYTYNPEGTNHVAGMLIERLEGILPHGETFRQHDVGDHHVLRTRPESRGTYIVGHMDTVFPPDHRFQTCRVEGQWLTGPGTGDMKGGLAVVAYALGALREAGLLDRLDVALILTGDEEIGAVTSRVIYEEERVHAAACLVAECAGPAGEVVISRNGKAGIMLTCSGEDMHVGRVSGAKRSAVLEMAHKVLALEALNGCLPGTTLNVGRTEGGIGPCTVPGEARSLVDVRWLEDTQYEAVLGRIKDIASKPSCPGCSCRAEVLNHRPAMPASEGSKALYSTLEGAARAVGIPVASEHRCGTSDANFFGSAGIPTLDGLGPVCHDDHTARERISIPSLASRTILLAVLIGELGARNL
jgi:glutamate carboxypeptidase